MDYILKWQLLKDTFSSEIDPQMRWHHGEYCEMVHGVVWSFSSAAIHCSGSCNWRTSVRPHEISILPSSTSLKIELVLFWICLSTCPPRLSARKHQAALVRGAGPLWSQALRCLLLRSSEVLRGEARSLPAGSFRPEALAVDQCLPPPRSSEWAPAGCCAGRRLLGKGGSWRQRLPAPSSGLRAAGLLWVPLSLWAPLALPASQCQPVACHLVSELAFKEVQAAPIVLNWGAALSTEISITLQEFPTAVIHPCKCGWNSN